MRMAPGENEAAAEKVADLAERVEALPDRVLLYADDGDAVVSVVLERGLRPEALLVRRSTLEDVFLASRAGPLSTESSSPASAALRLAPTRFARQRSARCGAPAKPDAPGPRP